MTDNPFDPAYVEPVEDEAPAQRVRGDQCPDCREPLPFCICATTAPASRHTVTIFPDMTQGSEEWMAARRGLLTASEMKLIITPATLKLSSNDKERAHVNEIAAQRISGYTEPSYIGDNMLRGWDDEIRARELYGKTYAPVTECGFITNDRWGFTLGYSPDALVGEHGLLECKSRRQKFQIETIASGQVPDEFVMQSQTGLLVSERQWIDFISYSGGLPMVVIRVEPDPEIQEAIIAAATAFEARVAKRIMMYREAITATDARMVPTERHVEQEMFQ